MVGRADIKKEGAGAGKSNGNLSEIVSAKNALLELLGEDITKKEYLDEVVKFIKSRTGAEYIGIRILDKNGSIPYESYIGFDKEFWESENWLSVKKDQCACIRVVTGKPEPQDMPAMTRSGSFSSGDTLKFLQGLSEKEKERFRGVCVCRGFMSISIIPIRHRQKILGAIHIADKRKNKVPLETVEFLEEMTPLIGAAINKFGYQDRLERANRDLKVLSRCNHILIHAKKEKELLDDVCKIIVEAGGYRMAWVGIAEDDDYKSVKAAAQRGFEDEYLESAQVSWSDKIVKGRGPTGMSIRTGRTVIGKDFLTDKKLLPWREQALKRGYRCSIALPLKFAGKIFGSLMIYSAETNSFDKNEVKLLEELANDLAFGISTIRMREDQKRSEDRLIESYRHLGTINRKISFLLDLERHVKRKKKKELAFYLLYSAISFSEADLGLVYIRDKNGSFRLLCAEGMSVRNRRNAEKVSSKKCRMVKALVREKSVIKGYSGRYDLDWVNPERKLKYFLALPLKREKKVEGFIFLGFKNKNGMESHESEFYEIFAIHASMALVNAGILK
ncbi:MAG: hypothetical protein A2288_00895 [Candidatus Moranbacteria bacterium RIFOXYA12_FULL_44_15]|nr:MAG: hypothetical protein A2288_00895 [Candidatus Moranbacteria bacterium RIFOXYA12_FULL_44_15]